MRLGPNLAPPHSSHPFLFRQLHMFKIADNSGGNPPSFSRLQDVHSAVESSNNYELFFGIKVFKGGVHVASLVTSESV